MDGRVFILEDDLSICSLIGAAFSMNGISLRAFHTVADFKAAFTEEPPDVALLDIMLPDGSGLDVLKYIKSVRPEVQCIMLSALSKEGDRVSGLNLGADDYISKPFSVLELIARVNVKLRNIKKSATLSAGDITLDTENMTARLSGKPLVLNKKEFALLKFLVMNAGKALARERILIAVWGYECGETRTLDNHIARLRKLGVKIETVFGVGYRLNV